MKKTTTPKRDIHAEVTKTIITLMESGNLPWEKPWEKGADRADGFMPYNAVSKKNYSGINTLLLWAASRTYGRNSWVTFKQAQELGGTVKKGEKASLVIFYKKLRIEDKVTKEKKDIPMLRHYYVFNTEQCEGLKLPALQPVIPPASPSGAVLDIANRLAVDLHHGGDRACFIPSQDSVHMPRFEKFKGEAEYSAVLAHELTHWTGHEKRLKRDLSGMFGCEKYAKEELIAEMGSAFLCAELGIEYEARHHAAYLQSWIKAAKEDTKFIFQSAAAASKAVSMLQGRDKIKEAEEAEEAADNVQKIQAIKAALN